MENGKLSLISLVRAPDPEYGVCIKVHGPQGPRVILAVNPIDHGEAAVEMAEEVHLELARTANLFPQVVEAKQSPQLRFGQPSLNGS